MMSFDETETLARRVEKLEEQMDALTAMLAEAMVFGEQDAGGFEEQHQRMMAKRRIETRRSS